MDGVLMTVRGQVALAGNKVCLDDLFELCGYEQKLKPLEWAEVSGLQLLGGSVASIETAMAYAWYLSPALGGSLQSQIDNYHSPYRVADKVLVEASAKSRDMLLSAFKKAGITHSHHFAKLTNQLYLSTLNTSSNSLSKIYRVQNGSVRGHLDTESLAKVMTAEINICSAIYTQGVCGYSEVLYLIKRHGELVQQIYRGQVH